MEPQLRIAVLDDERHVRESTAIMLDRCCHQVEVVLSNDPSLLTIEEIKKSRPGLVLMDLTYNSQQGWTLDELLQALGVPIVVVTAHDPDTMHSMYPDMPYLLKPISSKALTEVVRQVIVKGTVDHIEST